jgi:hypothetical protein
MFYNDAASKINLLFDFLLAQVVFLEKSALRECFLLRALEKMLCFELQLGAIVGRGHLKKLNKLPRVPGGSYLNRLIPEYFAG